MLGSNVLEVGMGLALIYVVLGLICSSINEFIAALLGSRAKNLEAGLKELLQDPNAVKGGLLSQFYDHPLIDGLYPGMFQAKLAPGGASTSAPNPQATRKAALPCYIPPKSFALTILDLIQPGEVSSPSGTAGSTPSPAQSLVNAATSTVDPGESPTMPPVTNSVAALRKSLVDSPLFQANPDLSRSLVTLIDASGNDMAQVRKNIEEWFDGAMERVSGIYKRRTQYVILAIGMVMALVVNVDSLAIANSLIRNKALQEILVRDSESFSKLVQDSKSNPSGNLSLTPQSQQWLDTRVKEVDPLGLPIGWKKSERLAQRDWGQSILGWLITGFAVSLGAPFWFDVLSRIMVVRSTIKPGERL